MSPEQEAVLLKLKQQQVLAGLKSGGNTTSLAQAEDPEQAAKDAAKAEQKKKVSDAKTMYSEMPWYEEMYEGGKSSVKGTGRALQQVYNLATGDDEKLAQLMEEEAKIRQVEDQMGGWGTAGKVGGEALQLMLGGGVVGAGGKLALKGATKLGAEALAKQAAAKATAMAPKQAAALSKLTGNSTARLVGGEAAAGAATNPLIAPRTSDESMLGTMAWGAGGNVAGRYAGEGLGKMVGNIDLDKRIMADTLRGWGAKIPSTYENDGLLSKVEDSISRNNLFRRGAKEATDVDNNLTAMNYISNAHTGDVVPEDAADLRDRAEEVASTLAELNNDPRMVVNISGGNSSGLSSSLARLSDPSLASKLTSQQSPLIAQAESVLAGGASPMDVSDLIDALENQVSAMNIGIADPVVRRELGKLANTLKNVQDDSVELFAHQQQDPSIILRRDNAITQKRGTDVFGDSKASELSEYNLPNLKTVVDKKVKDSLTRELPDGTKVGPYDAMMKDVNTANKVLGDKRGQLGPIMGGSTLGNLGLRSAGTIAGGLGIGIVSKALREVGVPIKQWANGGKPIPQKIIDKLPAAMQDMQFVTDPGAYAKLVARYLRKGAVANMNNNDETRPTYEAPPLIITKGAN